MYYGGGIVMDEERKRKERRDRFFDFLRFFRAEKCNDAPAFIYSIQD
jgi:hypothetical protein